MKTETATIYIAHDGSRHFTAEACAAHEAKADPVMMLVGKTEREIRDMVEYVDKIGANAIERLARDIQKKRIAAGELKRKGNAPSQPPQIANAA